MQDRQPPARRHGRGARWSQRWEDSLRARLGPSAWSAAPPCRSTRATRSAGGRSRCSATWSPTRCARAPAPTSPLLNAGTLRLDDVIRPGPLTNYQLESIFLFRRRDPGGHRPAHRGPPPDDARARRGRRLAGQGRVPAGLGGLLHLDPAALGQPDRRATFGGPPAASSRPNDTVRVAFPVYPACEGGDGYESPRPAAGLRPAAIGARGRWTC